MAKWVSPRNLQGTILVPKCKAMAPKSKGGAGHREMQEWVEAMRSANFTIGDIRSKLAANGCSKSRISQLCRLQQGAKKVNATDVQEDDLKEDIENNYAVSSKDSKEIRAEGMQEDDLKEVIEEDLRLKRNFPTGRDPSPLHSS